MLSKREKCPEGWESPEKWVEHHRECEELRDHVAALFIRDGKSLGEMHRRLYVLKTRLRSRKPGVAESVRLIDLDVT